MNNTAVLIWTPVLYFFCSLEHLWPLCTSLAGPGETTGPIYWQAQGRENTISWQKTSCPEQIPVSTQTHTGMASFPSLCLCSAQEVSSPSALIRRVCMQALVMHVITLCGVFICLQFFPRRRERARSPASCAVCSEEEHAFLKLNPEHTAALFRSRWLAEDVEGLSWPGDGAGKNK